MEKKLIDKKAFSQIIRSIIDCCYTHCKPDRFYRCSRGGIPEDCPIWQGLESVPEEKGVESGD